MPDELQIRKSTRHQKIIGDFGERVVSNWLSRSGFEVAVVDHTGIDVVAFNPATGDRLGITVKARTRRRGQENSSVNLFDYRRGKDDRRATMAACAAFACRPWIAVYVETAGEADLYLTSLENYDWKYRRRIDRKVDDWKMTQKDRDAYASDPAVKHVHLAFEARNWDVVSLPRRTRKEG
ncbi:MAG: hypothetical protein IT159_08240 [Bryobacterales bacterium]|nr:hypothetical protein [Bryobacterales bacterium]